MTHAINWNRAIATNRQALEQIVQEIFGLLEVAMTGTPALWPHQVQAMVRRLLRPAESALRRLIIIMARDVKVKLPPQRPMPKGLTLKRKGAGCMTFRLYDQRIRLATLREEKPGSKGPRIHFFNDLGPLVLAGKAKQSAAENLARRCTALTSALATLPKQARRMALWRLRRMAKANAKFKSPLRPGHPPGHQKRPRFEVDLVLATCHGLAHEALYANTS